MVVGTGRGSGEGSAWTFALLSSEWLVTTAAGARGQGEQLECGQWAGWRGAAGWSSSSRKHLGGWGSGRGSMSGQ